MANSSENRKMRRKRIFRLSGTKVRSHYASQVVNLFTRFPKSSHMSKTELQVKVVAVLSSDSSFMRSAPLRPGHPHCYSDASALGSVFFSVRPECVRIDIRASARI